MEFYSAMGEKRLMPYGNSGPFFAHCTLISGLAIKLFVLSLLSKETSRSSSYLGGLITLWQIIPAWRLSVLPLCSFKERNSFAFRLWALDRGGRSIVSKRSLMMQSCIAELLGIDS